MHELPQILATACYARVAPDGFMPEYDRFLQRMHWLLLAVQAEWASDQRATSSTSSRVLERSGTCERRDELELQATASRRGCTRRAACSCRRRRRSSPPWA